MLESGDLVLCTVDRVEKTIVFVKISSEGKEIDGSIVTSEIAPGRIRNIRDYVVPKKKIVCKILRVSGNGNIELSLRRVSNKEKKEVLDRFGQEKAFVSILKKILGEKSGDTIKEITQSESLVDFFDEAKENSKKLEAVVGKNFAEKILDIITSQKQKKIVSKKEINLKSEFSNGLSLIKETLSGTDADIRYVGSGKYSIKIESDEVKKTNNSMKQIIAEIERLAKKNKMDFSIKEK